MSKDGGLFIIVGTIEKAPEAGCGGFIFMVIIVLIGSALTNHNNSSSSSTSQYRSSPSYSVTYTPTPVTYGTTNSSSTSRNTNRSISSSTPTQTPRPNFRCAGALGPSFELNDRFIVPFGDGATTVWSGPNREPAITRVPEGGGGIIVSGPTCVEGQEGNLIAWYVRTDSGYEGYMSEGYLHSIVPFIIPVK